MPYSTLKGKLVGQREYLTRDEAQAGVFQYVEGFYDRHRMHSAIGYIIPEQEAELAAAA